MINYVTVRVAVNGGDCAAAQRTATLRLEERAAEIGESVLGCTVLPYNLVGEWKDSDYGQPIYELTGEIAL